MDKQRFAALFAGLSSVYGDKIPHTNACLNVWYASLADLDYKAVETAVLRYIQTEKFAPKPADIREIVLHASSTNKDGDAGASFEIAMSAVRRFGYSRAGAAQKWLDENYPLTGAVVERVGFKSICDSPIDSRGVLLGQFMKIYKDIAERKKQDAMTSPAVRVMIEKIRTETPLEDRKREALEAKA